MKRAWHQLEPLITERRDDALEALKHAVTMDEVARLQGKVEALEWVVDQSDVPEPTEAAPPEPGYS